jgi:hypothetical protein
MNARWAMMAVAGISVTDLLGIGVSAVVISICLFGLCLRRGRGLPFPPHSLRGTRRGIKRNHPRRVCRI